MTLLLALFALIRSARPRTVERAAGEAAFGVATVYLLGGLTDNTLDNYLLGTAVWGAAGLAAVAARRDA